MATTNLVVQIQTRGQRKLDAAHQSFGRLDRAVQQVNGKLPRTSAGLNRVGNSAEKANTGVRKLTRTLGTALKAFALIQSARFVFFKTAELETQTRSLQVLTGSAEKAKKIIGELQEFANVTPFTSTELVETAKRLKAFGFETEKLVETTKRLGDVAGATGADLGGIATAFGQIQAKGRLQGEELLQLQERGINLQEELQKMYGLTGEEFRQALQKGQFSADAVNLALQRLTETGGKYADGAIAQSDTLNGKLSTLQDGIDNVARRIGQVLSPALKAVFDQAIAVVDVINQALGASRGRGFSANVFGARQALNIGATSEAVDRIAKGLKQVNTQNNATGINQNLQALQKYQRLLQSIGPNDPNSDRAVKLQRVILQKINENQKAQERLNKTRKEGQKIFQNPEIPPLLNNDGKKQSGKGTKGRIVDDGSNLLRQLQQQTAAAQAKQGLDSKILQISQRYSDTLAQIGKLEDQSLAAQLQEQALKLRNSEITSAIKEVEDRRQKTLQQLLTGFDNEIALSKVKGAEAKRLLKIEQDIARLRDQGILKTDAEIESYRQRATAAGALKGELSETEKLTRDIAQTVAQDLSRGIQGLIAGTTTLNDIASQLLSKLGGLFLDAAFSGALKGMGIKGFADGGQPPVNKPSVVGEQGPEIFVPSVAGNILPNDVSSAFAAGREALAGSPGSSSAGLEGAFSDNQASLGASTAVVQRNADAVKMQQSLSNSAVRVEVDTVRVADLDVVTLEQLQTSMAVTARQARAQVFSDMRNKPSTRSSLGMR